MASGRDSRIPAIAGAFLAGILASGGVAYVYFAGGDDGPSSGVSSDAGTQQKAAASEEPEVEARPFEAPEPVDLRDPPSEPRTQIDLGEPRRYPACRDIFESGDEIASEFLPDRDRKEWVVYGCSPEAYRRLEDGTRYIAYRLAPDPSGGRDLRFVAYGPEGDKKWAYLLGRSDYSENFAANFRSSFIAPLPPHLVCVGTLWAADTQVSCLDAETGEPEWEGKIGFWSGIPLRGHDVALHGADITGLTRRYPYSGVEMERTEFDREGGHAGLYVTDGERLYFAPPEGEPSRLTAYSFASMEPTWRTELPGRPDSGFTEAGFAEHGIVAVKIEERLYGFDADDGAVRWAFEVGDDRPPIAAGPDRMYLFLQRPEQPSLLFAIAPDSGDIEWYGPVPTGTLNVAWRDETVLVRSVRAFQPVRGTE